jgi:hypothetical protein
MVGLNSLGFKPSEFGHEPEPPAHPDETLAQDFVIDTAPSSEFGQLVWYDETPARSQD